MAKVSMKATEFVYRPAVGNVLNGTHEERQTNVQVIGEHLESIEKKNGCIKPAMVVDSARPKNSPIHKHFEWDDTVAGEKYRLGQARQLISSVYIKSHNDITPSSPVRAFVNVLRDDVGDRRYESITTVMSDEQKREQLLNRAKREFETWQKRYEALQELSDVFEAFKHVA